ncbi:chromosome (plasmid) partitioning protein parb / stage 0 sporulation protein j [hydrocarbon metagenome]|uniref:Chromosome (Plasmid) partitioning protein parb / stage 0 sporulation protein j n=1 Tax=hydrocarbon metagenome TaxID=938273 RepID=A0A0W8E1S6_9ZZZZ
MSKRNWPWMVEKSKNMEIINIPLEKIQRNPYQPRLEFDENELIDLAKSIRSYGLIQPIVVRAVEDGYQIVAGERRYRACCMLGMKEIQSVVQEMNDEKVAAVSLIENIQRKELNYFEEANAYSILINQFGMTQDELARKIGRSQSAIANKLRILKLPEAVKELIEPAVVTERHARALLKINNAETQIEIIRQIFEKDLTVKETEELVDRLSRNNIPGESKRSSSNQNVSMIIRDARIFLNTIRETIKRARQTGVDIVMDERDLEDAYEITIKIAKTRKSLRKIPGS